MEMLQVNKVSKVYGDKLAYRALNQLSFSVAPGEFVGIMGPSGSGKTTLLNMIATIDKPTTGEITIGGRNPHALGKRELAKFRRRELGFIFQDFNLLNTLTVAENIILPLTLDGKSVRYMREQLEEIAQKLGITHILDKRIFEISGGQAQRAAIARSIIHAPKLLLADEPTGNLDSKAAKDVMLTLEGLNRHDRSTMLLVTHDAVAASYCNRVIFIKDGALYTEIHRGEHRKAFFQTIIDTLSLMGGDAHDLSSIHIQ